MMQNARLEQIVFANKGIIQTADAVDAGISKPVFYKFISEHNFEQVAHGIYLSPDAWIDTMYVISLRSKQAVFSHETALFLHNLTDREPVQYSITAKTGYNPSKLKADGIKVYTIKKELYNIGLTETKTTFDHTVRIYNMERTICDIIRSRNTIEIQSFQDALKQYAKRKEKNLRLLMQYAQQFHVDKMLNKYLEVLL
jgi:predicted transcriptional regulator of viral defense system